MIKTNNTNMNISKEIESDDDKVLLNTAKTVHYYKCVNKTKYTLWEHEFNVSTMPFKKDDDEEFTDYGCIDAIPDVSSYWIVYFFFENYVESVDAFPTKELAYAKFLQGQKELQDKSIKYGGDLIFRNEDGKISCEECEYDKYTEGFQPVDKTWKYIMEKIYL